MSSTSTNKQPLLIDRPLHEFAILGATPALVEATNFATVLGGGCVPLVDCVDNDGAVIDSLSVVALQVGTSAVSALFLLSTSPTAFGITASNTAVVASAVVQSIAAGDRTNVPLPPLCVPVPNLGAESDVTEANKKNTGLYVPAGRVLYTGLSTAISAPSPATKVNIFAQGGYF